MPRMREEAVSQFRLVVSRPVRFRLAKRLAANLLCSRRVGRIIQGMYGEHIPWRITGPRVKVPKKAAPHLVASIFWGLYESAEIRFVRRYLALTSIAWSLEPGSGW